MSNPIDSLFTEVKEDIQAVEAEAEKVAAAAVAEVGKVRKALLAVVPTLLSLVTGAISYAIHLGIVAILAWAAKHGLHFGVPVFPVSLLSFVGLGYGKLVVSDLTRSYHTTKSEILSTAAAKAAIAELRSAGLLSGLLFKGEGESKSPSGFGGPYL